MSKQIQETDKTAITLLDLYSMLKETLGVTEAKYLKVMSKIVEQYKTNITQSHQLLTKRLGVIYLAKKKRGKTINYQKKKELDKLIYNFNFHTDGYIYSIKWEKGGVKWKNRRYYRFVPCRKLTRYLSTELQNGLEPLIIVPTKYYDKSNI